MKKIFLILTLLIIAVIVVVFLFSRQDERQIRRNMNSLLVSAFDLIEEDGIAALIEARRIGTFFTEDCQIIVGSPIPEIRGRETLIVAVYGVTRNIVTNEIRIDFHDVSITIAENRVMATSIKTVVATGAHGREIRNIKMHWEKIEGRWEIATAKSIPILY